MLTIYIVWGLWVVLYVVSLCDGLVSREVYVEGDGSVWLAIIVSLGFMTAFFGFLSFIIKDKKLKGLRVLMFFLTSGNAFLLAGIPMLISFNPTDSSAFLPVSIGYFSVHIVAFLLFIWLYGFYLVENIFKKKKESDY